MWTALIHIKMRQRGGNAACCKGNSQIDKKDKNIENELKSARTLQKHYVLCGIARIGILSDDINGEVNIA